MRVVLARPSRSHCSESLYFVRFAIFGFPVLFVAISSGLLQPHHILSRARQANLWTACSRNGPRMSMHAPRCDMMQVPRGGQTSTGIISSTSVHTSPNQISPRKLKQPQKLLLLLSLHIMPAHAGVSAPRAAFCFDFSSTCRQKPASNEPIMLCMHAEMAQGAAVRGSEK
jgi:hypothetical protein